MNAFSRLPTALSAVALATVALAPATVLAHGAPAKMVPLNQAAKDFSAHVQWDSYANVYTITRNSTLVRVRPGARTITINGSPLRVDVPLVVRQGQAMVADGFLKELFQSSLDKTFVLEAKPHPLNPLSPAEIEAAVGVLKASGRYKDGLRFAEIILKAPPKDEVWAYALDEVPVQARARPNWCCSMVVM